METHNPSPHILRSAMFLAGWYQDLFHGSDPYAQLDGTLELFDLANNYVLNDSTAIGGAVYYFGGSEDDITKFLSAEARSSDSIETIGPYCEYDFDLRPFEEALGLPPIRRRLSKLPGAAYTPEDMELGDQARILQMQSYILLADSIGAAYVPERRYGQRALELYPKVISMSPHIQTERFRQKLMARLSEIAPMEPILRTLVPSFLTEAVRNAATPAGIASALRDLRYSAAAEKYRALVRTMTDESCPLKERLDAANELQARAGTVFSKEGLQTRIPRWFKAIVALSAAAVGILFPSVRAMAAAPALAEAIDAIDLWLRRRSNIFEVYAGTLGEDLFAELKRLFPNIRFGAVHLSHFLSERNFGWSDEHDLLRFMYGSPNYHDMHLGQIKRAIESLDPQEDKELREKLISYYSEVAGRKSK